MTGALAITTCTDLQRRKVDDIVDIWIFLKHLVKCRLVCDVDLVEGWSLAANELDAVDDFWRRVVEVVNDDDFVVCFEEGESCKGANVAGTTKPPSVLLAHEDVAELHGGVEG